MSDSLLILDCIYMYVKIWLSVILFANSVSAKNTTEPIYAGNDLSQPLQIALLNIELMNVISSYFDSKAKCNIEPVNWKMLLSLWVISK